eukprot:gb/GECH01013992.1/.p1 GENE.gb/GECH01013992.1/~~gb/GECH01013992.1/.p1  ORF type:complete len:191 (+),score=50.75 gb/GECH01013992.1/:1-573(+)
MISNQIDLKPKKLSQRRQNTKSQLKRNGVSPILREAQNQIGSTLQNRQSVPDKKQDGDSPPRLTTRNDRSENHVNANQSWNKYGSEDELEWIPLSDAFPSLLETFMKGDMDASNCKPLSFNRDFHSNNQNHTGPVYSDTHPPTRRCLFPLFHPEEEEQNPHQIEEEFNQLWEEHNQSIQREWKQRYNIDI